MPDLNRKIAYINPWGEHGEGLVLKINGHTGLAATIGGADYIPYNSIKDMPSYRMFDIYDYVLVPFWGGFYDFIIKLKATSVVKVIGVGDVELNAIPYAPRPELAKLVKCARLCDIMLLSNPDTMSLFSSIRHDFTYDIMGWSIFDFYKNRIIQPEKKDQNQISIGCSNSGYNRNILENFLVFSKLLQKKPDLKGHYWCVHPDHQKEIMALAAEIGIPQGSVILRNEMDYQTFLYEFSRMYISIHLYTFKVVSRMAQDAMSLGIPHVGCNENYSDRIYCPASVNAYDVQSGYDQALRLLNEPEFYSMARMEQVEGVDLYSQETIGSKIIGAIEDYERRKAA